MQITRQQTYSPHPADDEEEEVMEDVEEDEPDPTRVSPTIITHPLASTASASAMLSAKGKSNGSKSRLPLRIDDYAQQLRNQIAA
jgi:hypothetical protein